MRGVGIGHMNDFLTLKELSYISSGPLGLLWKYCNIYCTSYDTRFFRVI